MKKSVMISIVVIVIAFLVGAVFYITSIKPAALDTDNSMMEEESVSDENMSDESTAMEESRYIEYNAEKFAQASNKKRVYFFHASWCPTCKIVNKEFSENSADIPEDVILFKTDYDTENELKKKFGITYQHTFVLVDENGNEITQWNGGGTSELVANTR